MLPIAQECHIVPRRKLTSDVSSCYAFSPRRLRLTGKTMCAADERSTKKPQSRCHPLGDDDIDLYLHKVARTVLRPIRLPVPRTPPPVLPLTQDRVHRPGEA